MPADELARLRTLVPNFPSVLPPADMREVVLDTETSLAGAILGDEKFGGVSLVDARLADANLATVDWTCTKTRSLWPVVLRQPVVGPIQLGDERQARDPMTRGGIPKNTEEWLTGYKEAVRANRQLATALRQQGLNEDAGRYAYRAQMLQRQVLLRQGRSVTAFGSWILDAISGYGYLPMRSVLTYSSFIMGFALIYFLFRESVHPAFTPVDALVFSITSFHGRGFSPGESVTLHNPLTIFAALEAIVGLVIEITFIATFTQRFAR